MSRYTPLHLLQAKRDPKLVSRLIREAKDRKGQDMYARGGDE